MKVIKEGESRIYLDGPEICREYVITLKIASGSSIPHPGQTGGIDPGRPENHEVFYVSRGEVLMHSTQIDELYELHEGDITLVYGGEPYELTNIGTNMAVIARSCTSKID